MSRLERLRNGEMNQTLQERAEKFREYLDHVDEAQACSSCGTEIQWDDSNCYQCFVCGNRGCE